MLAPSLISVTEAQHLVLKTVKPGPAAPIILTNACGYVLSHDLRSPISSPPFHQSAMDGYAFRFRDYIRGMPIEVTGESAAGVSFAGKVGAGEAVRIFTGAEIPPGADTVVMQEKILVKNGLLLINDPLLQKGANIRKAGSQIKKGEKALLKGHLITPASQGFLASLGFTRVPVYQKPKVIIIATGSELVPPGKPLGRGQVYESNAITLKSLLAKEGITNVKIKKVSDNRNATLKAFRTSIVSADLILFSGGISVGDYDFVSDVLSSEKVRQIFYKVKQKPGKPVYFGMKGKKVVFGLPGNPASAATCFYEYVIPALRAMQKHPEKALRKLSLPLIHPVRKKAGLTLFLKAFTDLLTVRALEGQESYIMQSFAGANCFIVLDENSNGEAAGTLVKVQLFI